MGITTLFFASGSFFFWRAGIKDEGGQAESRADGREGVEAKQGCGGLGGGWLPVNVAGC